MRTNAAGSLIDEVTVNVQTDANGSTMDEMTAGLQTDANGSTLDGKTAVVQTDANGSTVNVISGPQQTGTAMHTGAPSRVQQTGRTTAHASRSGRIRSTSASKPTGTSLSDAVTENTTDIEIISNWRQWFLAAYVPTILAVVYAIPWVIVNQATKYIAPYYLLSKPGGAPAGSTITSDPTSLWAPFKAIHQQQWASVVSSMNMWVSILITPLSPQAIGIHLNGDCDATTGGCTGRLGIYIPVARAIQGLLILVAVLTLVLIAILWLKRAKLSSDPRSIAGLAIYLGDRTMRGDLASVQAASNDEELKSALRTYWYKLDTMVSPDGAPSTVLMRVGETSPPRLSTSRDKKGYSVCVSRSDDLSSPEPADGGTIYLPGNLDFVATHRWWTLAFFVFLAALTTLIVVYRFTGGDNGFERFMDSQSFGVKFLFTSIGVLISFFWRRMFQGKHVRLDVRESLVDCIL